MRLTFYFEALTRILENFSIILSQIFLLFPKIAFFKKNLFEKAILSENGHQNWTFFGFKKYKLL